jgi:hypothetical protein
MAGPYRRIQISKGEEKEKEERRETKNTRIRGTLSVHTHLYTASRRGISRVVLYPY